MIAAVNVTLHQVVARLIDPWWISLPQPPTARRLLLVGFPLLDSGLSPAPFTWLDERMLAMAAQACGEEVCGVADPWTADVAAA